MVVIIWEDNVNALKKENIEFTFSKGKNANSISDKKVIKSLYVLERELKR